MLCRSCRQVGLSREQWKCLRFSSSPICGHFPFTAETGTHSASHAGCAWLWPAWWRRREVVASLFEAFFALRPAGRDAHDHHRARRFKVGNSSVVTQRLGLQRMAAMAAERAGGVGSASARQGAATPFVVASRTTEYCRSSGVSLSPFRAAR